MDIENFKFRNSHGQELPARLYYNDRNNKRGVLFSHGLFSSKDGYKITQMAEYIVNAGYTLMTFDFTYSGESPGDICDISVMQEVDDLLRAADVFGEKGIENVHLMGSSMGGVVSILAGSSEALSPESIMLIATPLKFDGLIPADISDKENEDDMVYISGVQVNKKFINELKSLDVASAVEKITCPVLLIHGKLDAVVSFKDFEKIKKLLTTGCDSLLIEDGDHNLTDEKHLNLIKEKVKNWLGKFVL